MCAEMCVSRIMRETWQVCNTIILISMMVLCTQVNKMYVIGTLSVLPGVDIHSE